MSPSGTQERLRFFPKQGAEIRLVEAPEPCFEAMVGWKFTVHRRQLGPTTRLRASDHTKHVVVELVWFDGDARYFEAAT